METLFLHCLERYLQSYFILASLCNIVFSHSLFTYFQLACTVHTQAKHSDNIELHGVCPFNDYNLAKDGFVRNIAINPVHPAMIWLALCACISSASSLQCSGQLIQGQESPHQCWQGSLHRFHCCKAKCSLSCQGHPPCTLPLTAQWRG